MRDRGRSGRPNLRCGHYWRTILSFVIVDPVDRRVVGRATVIVAGRWAGAPFGDPHAMPFDLDGAIGSDAQEQMQERVEMIGEVLGE